MKAEQLLKCIGMIDDDLLCEADSYVPAPKIKPLRLAAAASIAACLCAAAISIFAAVRNNNDSGIVLETTSETTVYDTTAPQETNADIDNTEPPTVTESITSAQSAYISDEQTGTMTSVGEITTLPQDTTVIMTTETVTEDIPEDETDIAYEEPLDYPDLPQYGTIAEYFDYFDAYDRSVKIGYEYIDPTFDVSIMKFIDADISDVEAVLDKISGSAVISYGGGIKSRKIDSIVFLDGENELFRITVGKDGKALLDPQDMEGSAVFDVPSEIYDEIYDIAAQIGGFSYFENTEADTDEVLSE